jgi:hypothetical protein
VTKKYNITKPASMLERPTKRICPSLIFVARSNTLRQVGGLRKGKNPSITNISAIAPNVSSMKPGAANGYFFADGFGALG